MSDKARLARRTDPDASHIAAGRDSATRRTNEEIVLALVRRYPGRSSRSLWLRLPEGQRAVIDRAEVHRRLSDARNKGLVHNGPRSDTCLDSGRKELTWHPGPKPESVTQKTLEFAATPAWQQTKPR